MKNFLNLILCINLFISPAYALITDDFAEKTLEKSLQIKEFQVKTTEDELVNNTLGSLKLENYDASKFYIVEELPLKSLKPIEYRAPQIKDDFLPVLIAEKKHERVFVDYENFSDGIQVPIRILVDFSTKTQQDEGTRLDFETVSDVRIKNILYPKGTIVQGRIETISMNQWKGVPADLVVGSFVMKNVALSGELKKIGANRSLWIYPCMTAGSIFFGAGLLLMPIRGGHAKISKNETVTLYAQK